MFSVSKGNILIVILCPVGGVKGRVALLMVLNNSADYHLSHSGYFANLILFKPVLS